ncbi:hypothetical protein TNCV_5020621 [Trichonephila clavipes]|nr:hypothetical protein TNCV_5020621 [Trichonephila clavipes]
MIFLAESQKIAERELYQQRCEPHTAGGGTVEHSKMLRTSPRYRLLRRESSQPGLDGVNGLGKQHSSYGPRGRSQEGEVTSVPANLLTLVQSMNLNMLYPMHFAHLH